MKSRVFILSFLFLAVTTISNDGNPFPSPQAHGSFGKASNRPDPLREIKSRFGNGQPNPRPSRSRGTSERRGRFVSFALSPILTRDGEGLKRLDIPKAADRIELKLALRDTTYRKFNAEIQTFDGQTVWSQNGLVRQGEGSRAFVAVRLKTSVLSKTDYFVVLEGVAADGTSEVVGEYPFSAVRK